MGAITSRAVSACRALAMALAALSLAACAGMGPRYPIESADSQKPPSKYSGYHVGKPYEVDGHWYTPMDQPDYDEVGTASWYGEQFHNRYTADGEVFDMGLPSAAHKTLPLPSLVEVTNLANGRKITVRVNDRGPFVDGRIIDMSREAAQELGFLAQGIASVRVRYVGPAPANPGGVTLYDVAAVQPSAPKPAPRPLPAPAKTQIASAGGVLLGADIDDRPLQSSPADRGWDALAPAKPPAKGEITAAPVVFASANIDSLLDELANPPPGSSFGPLVQTGVFSTRANAERAASRLEGRTEIVPIEQSGRVLYKVLGQGPAGGN